MTVRDFCRHETQPLELCVIRDSGYIICTAWIDYEDLFVLPKSIRNEKVKHTEWGHLSIREKCGSQVEVPCHYIDI